MLKLKRILSYIYKQRSHASCCLSKIDIPVVQNDSLSCCSFLEHLHSTSCQQTGLWFKRLNNNYSVIILQHSMSSGNHTADHPLKIALMSMSLSKVLLSRDCLSVQFVYFNLLYIPHFQLRERRWMEINNDTFTIRFLWQRPLLRCCGFNATTTQWQTSFVNDRSNCKVKIIASWKKKKKALKTQYLLYVCMWLYSQQNHSYDSWVDLYFLSLHNMQHLFTLTFWSITAFADTAVFPKQNITAVLC